MELNDKFELAKDLIENHNANVFLTGKAGTGKTTFLRNLTKESSKNIVVTAPTGIAALNAGGVTLHSLFQIKNQVHIPGDKVSNYKFTTAKKELIKSIDLLVIDEVSMLRCDLLDAVDAVLRYIKRNNMPFGGIQLLLIGDLLQLPSFFLKNEKEILEEYYDSPHFFNSFAFQKIDFATICVDKIYRQDNQRFIDILEHMRYGNLTHNDIKVINSRVDNDFDIDNYPNHIKITTHKRIADEFNMERLEELPDESYYFEGDIDGDFHQKDFPVDEVLELKLGAKVMLVRNDTNRIKRYYNGSIGEIVGFNEDETISVKVNGLTIDIERCVWENIDYKVETIGKKKTINQEVVGSYTQFPLKLAWAINVHKCQGLTFDNVILDTRSVFQPGMAYVAFSRCRSLEGIVLEQPINPKCFYADNNVNKFLKTAFDEADEIIQNYLDQVPCDRGTHRWNLALFGCDSKDEDREDMEEDDILYEEFYKLKLKEKELKERIEELKAKVVARMYRDDLDKYEADSFTITYSSGSRRRFDTNAFKNDYAELYKKYYIQEKREPTVILRFRND